MWWGSRAALVVLLLAATCVHAKYRFGYRPRRNLFARCSSEEKMPRAVYVTCANKQGICQATVGSTHNVRVLFVSDHNTTDVGSYGRWNSWFEIPLPNQNRDACNGQMKCPVKAGYLTRFEYALTIEDFWPKDEYPVIWTLTDRITNEPMVCFKLRISVL